MINFIKVTKQKQKYELTSSQKAQEKLNSLHFKLVKEYIDNQLHSPQADSRRSTGTQCFNVLFAILNVSSAIYKIIARNHRYIYDDDVHKLGPTIYIPDI